MHTRSALALKFNEHEKIISTADILLQRPLQKKHWLLHSNLCNLAFTELTFFCSVGILLVC